MNYTSMEIIDKIICKIKEKKGIDFSQYKINTIFRRIKQRYHILNIQSIEDYFDFFQKNFDKETDILINYFFINTSEFFRNPIYFYYFEYLAKSMINRGIKFIKILSLGCSSGEEPYSIAIILNEQKTRHPDFDFHIDALDIDKEAIKEAKKAVYFKESIENIPLYVLEKYFVKAEDKYKLSTNFFNDKIHFDLKNILEIDTIKQTGIFSYDFVFARNIFLYFKHEEVKKLLKKIITLLNKDGFLILGDSELIIDKYKNYFSQVCKGMKIYRLLQ